jgi:hypothetical protein
MEANQPERDEYGRIVEESSITEDQYNALFEDSSEGPDNVEADNESDEQSGVIEPNATMSEPKVDSPPVVRKPILTICAEQPKPQPVQKAPIKIDLDKEMSTIKYADGINPVSLPVIKQARAEGRAPPAVEIVEDDEPTCTTQPMSANAIKRLESREANKYSEAQVEKYIVPKVEFAELAEPSDSDDPSDVRPHRLKRSESFNNEQSSTAVVVFDPVEQAELLYKRSEQEIKQCADLELRLLKLPHDRITERNSCRNEINRLRARLEIYSQGEDPDLKEIIGKDLNHLMKGMHISRTQFTETNQQLDHKVIFVEMQNDINEICMYDIETAWRDCNRHFGDQRENRFRDQSVLQIVSTLGPQKIGILFNAHPENYTNDLKMLKTYIKAYALEKPFNMSININDMIVANGKYISLLIITSYYVKDYATKDRFVKGLYEYIRARSSMCFRLRITPEKHPTIADAELFPLMLRRNMSTADAARVESDGRMPSINFIAGATEVGFTIYNDNSVNITNNNTINGGNNNKIVTGGTVSELVNMDNKTSNIHYYNEFMQNIDRDKPHWCVKGARIPFMDLRAYYELLGGKTSMNNFAKLLTQSGMYQKVDGYPNVNGKRTTVYTRL